MDDFILVETGNMGDLSIPGNYMGRALFL